VAVADAYLQRLAEYGYSGSMAVAEGREVVLAAGYGLADREAGVAMTADTGVDIGSLTKQLTAALILALEAEGRLAVDDPLGRYFDSVPADKEAITLHHLLTHTSGLPSTLFGDTEPVGRDALVSAALASDLVAPPGERFSYSNLGYSLLAAIVEKVTGETYGEALRQRVLQPAGLERTGYRLPDTAAARVAHGYRSGKDVGSPADRVLAPDGEAYWGLRGNGGLISTANDMIRWHLALAENDVLAPEVRSKLFAPHVEQPTGYGSHYGYGWFIDAKAGRALHGGSDGTFTAELRRDIGDVGELDGGEGLFLASTVADFPAGDLAKAVEAILAGSEATLPPEVTAVPSSTLGSLEGTCAPPEGGRLLVAALPGVGLEVAAEGQAAIDALYGYDADVRATLVEVNRRTREIVESSLAGDFEPLRRAFGSRVDAAIVDFLSQPLWDRFARENGTLESFELLGSHLDGGFRVSRARVRYENGTVPLAYLWAGESLAGIQDSRPARRVFRPVSGTGFAAFDASRRTVTRLEAMADGAGNDLTLITRGQSVPCRRAAPEP